MLVIEVTEAEIKSKYFSYELEVANKLLPTGKHQYILTCHAVRFPYWRAFGIGSKTINASY